MSSGTSGSMRKLRALLTTKWPAAAKALFDVAGHGGVERRKHDFRAATRRARLDGAAAGGVRDRVGQAPRRDVVVGLAFGALAGGEPGEDEPGMARQARDELLTDNAGRAKHADVDPLPSSSRKQKTRLGICRGGLLVAR